jgi:hypothetical protein
MQGFVEAIFGSFTRSSEQHDIETINRLNGFLAHFFDGDSMETHKPNVPPFKMSPTQANTAMFQLLVENKARLELILENQINDIYADSDLSSDEVQKRMNERFFYFRQKAWTDLIAAYGDPEITLPPISQT